MAWEAIPVFTRKTGSPLVSAQLRKNKVGQVTVNVFVSPFIIDALGAPEKVSAQFGRAEHAGLLRIGAGSDALHSLKAIGRAGRRICLPTFDGLPSGTTDSFPCTVVEQSPEALVIRLPVAEWEVSISKRAASVVPKREVPTPAPVPPSESAVTVDMVEFLRPKGVKVSKLGGGRYSVDGETFGAEHVLSMVNAYRKRAGLKLLTASEVR